MTTIFNTITGLEATATALAVVYVWLSSRNRPVGWVFGIVSCALWAYVTWVDYRLLADALLQVFYVGMGAWGLYVWHQGDAGGQPLPITRVTPSEHAIYMVVGTATGLLAGYALGHTTAAATYWDALTTSFSVLATWMLVRRKLENWLYWIVVDIAYMGLYANRGAVLFAGVMAIYTVVAVYGWFHWRRIYLEKI